MKCCNRKCRTYKRYGYHWCVRCGSLYSILTENRIGHHDDSGAQIGAALNAERDRVITEQMTGGHPLLVDAISGRKVTFVPRDKRGRR
jgi:hypothetical protein